MFIGPLDFFDTLARLDWSQRFEPFGKEDADLLARYDGLAAELGGRSFFAQPQRLSFKAAPDESYERVEHAGEDALRSMAMTFRRLWLKKEPARFEAVLRLLRDHTACTADGLEARRLLDIVGARFRIATRAELMKHVWDDDPFGEPIRVFRARQVIDDWFYAGPFHEDPERAKRVRAWSPAAYEWSFIKAVHEVAVVIWELQVVVSGIGPASVALEVQ